MALTITTQDATPTATLCGCTCHANPEVTGCVCTGDAPCGYILRLIETSREVPVVEAAYGRTDLLLDVLGITPDPEDGLIGEMPADVFLGRVLLALGLAPTDAGIPTHGEGNWIDAGRPEGWLQDKLAELHQLAEYALTHGHKVVWDA